jgi:zinc transport system ATP-binding protein
MHMTRATAGTEPPLLEISDLVVRRHGEALLDRVSLSVERSSLHVVVGPNGAGKSTLIHAVLGQIAFDGRILAHWRREGTIGYVPQNFTVDSTLPVTVEDFLALTRQRWPVCLGIARGTRDRVAQLLNNVGLDGLQRRALSVLSGGELRRVLLAHALDPVPELLILDEPTSGLDETAMIRLEETLVSIRKQHDATVLMVSHDLAQVRRLADTVTVLDRSVLACGPASQVLARESVVALLPSVARGRC